MGPAPQKPPDQINYLAVQIQPVAIVRNAVKTPTDESWGSVISRIELMPAYSGALSGLDQFSHALVVFHMHEATYIPSEHLQRHPRDRTDLPLMGIFAQRGKHRPNAIGIAAVEIVSVEGDVLEVRGLDAIDGTPVLDIKPYVPWFDKRDSQTPAWMADLMADYF